MPASKPPTVGKRERILSGAGWASISGVAFVTASAKRVWASSNALTSSAFDG